MTGLVKKIDEATQKNDESKMGSFVVVLAADADKKEAELKKLAEKEGLKKVALTIDSPAGPSGYKIAKDADVTVLLYVNKTVKKNFAFKKGELTDAKAEEVLKELPSILPEKK